MEDETYEYIVHLVIVVGILVIVYLYGWRKINLNDILQNHYYINLDHRTDRNESTIKELRKLGIHNPHRFSAIKKDNGAIGCYMSHLEVLKSARARGLPYVTIFEDDILCNRGLGSLSVNYKTFLDTNDYADNIFQKHNMKRYINALNKYWK